jgi:hypothetical protein
MTSGRSWRPPSAPDRWAAAGLALFAALFFIRPLTGHGRLYVWDLTTVWDPIVASALRSVASGSWPLWDPFRGFGKPLLADPNSMLAYPFTWLNLILPAHVYYVWFVVAHLVFSAWGLYSLARRWGLSHLAALVAAGVWIGSGPLLGIAYLWHHFAGAAWIPWVFLAADIALERRTLRHAVAWGAAWGMQMLAGSADMVLLGGVALLSYVLTYHVQWGQLLGRPNRLVVRSCALAAAFALALSAVQWMPALELLAQSTRHNLPASEREAWSLHPLAALEVAFPIFWRLLPQVPSDPMDYVDLQGGLVSSVYLGVPALMLVAAALTAGSGRRRFWLGLTGLAAFAVALGRHAPAYRLLVLLVPLLRIVRYPVKAMVVVGFCWSLLAGLGLERVRALAPETQRRFRWGVVAPATLLAVALAVMAAITLAGGDAWTRVFAHLPPPGEARAILFAPAGARLGIACVLAMVGLALAFQGLRPSAPPRRTSPGLAIVVALDLLAAHWSLHPVAPVELFDRPAPVLGVLSKDPYPRVYSYDYRIPRGPRPEGERWGFILGPIRPGWARSWAWLYGLRMDLYPPINAVWGVYGSYNADLLRLYPAPLQQLTDFCWASENNRALHLRLLQMGGVHDVIALSPDAWWQDLQPVAAIPGPFERPFQVLKVPDPLPRAYVVGTARVADGDEALRRIADPSFDPREEVLLAGTDLPARSEATFKGSCRLVSLKPDRIVVEAETDRAGYLVLLDAYDPGWRATINGVPARIVRANLAFRAVPLGIGPQRIEMVYRPRSVVAGLSISLAALVVGLALCAGSGRP